MKHPNFGLEEPTTDPDYRSHTIEIWFKEGIYSYERGDLRWDVTYLAVCPITGQPMYMTANYPIQWLIITNKDILEAFMRYTLEKELLGIDIFAEGKDDKT